MVLPKIETEANSQNYGHFVISPLESGYGITLGNALRRVLLSSLTGAAITSIRISGVHHEFSAIPHVREDTTQLILNIKQIRLRNHSEEPVRISHRDREQDRGGNEHDEPASPCENDALLPPQQPEEWSALARHGVAFSSAGVSSFHSGLPAR